MSHIFYFLYLTGKNVVFWVKIRFVCVDTILRNLMLKSGLSAEVSFFLLIFAF